MAIYRGVVKNRTVVLEEALPYAEGTEVVVAIFPYPPKEKGSPVAILEALGGTLTPEEAEQIAQAVMASRKIDPEMWDKP